MRTSNHTILVACLLLVTLGFNSVKAQTAEDLKSQAQWMTAWAAWMNATGHNNVQAQMVEAQAKLISAQATLVTAAANANKANTEALENLEKTRGLALDNNQKRAEVFYTKKALYDNHRKLNGIKSRPTKEDAIRYSQATAPQRLTKEEFDQIRGEIIWPALLQREEFSEERERLDALFVKRLDFNQNISQEVQHLTEQMSYELRSLVREVPSSEYIKSRKFIHNLAYEARFDSPLLEQVGKIAVAN